MQVSRNSCKLKCLFNSFRPFVTLLVPKKQESGMLDVVSTFFFHVLESMVCGG